jgi:uncharacterized protein
MTPDVNLLIAAARPDHAHHARVAAWLLEKADTRTSGSTFVLMPMVVASFLRLVTNPKIFKFAASIETAIDYIDALLALPGAEMVDLGSEWSLLRQLCIDKRLTANALPDAWLAASVIARGEHLVTFDADFRKLLPRNQVTVLKVS